MANEARKFFVTRDAACRVVDACPDAEWRLLFALSRFGGLRCPSEHLALTWPDVDWERNRFRVVSPNTEHLEGQGVRWVPIFKELRPYLEEAFELAPEGALHVITRYRDPSTNLRTQLQRILRRAGEAVAPDRLGGSPRLGRKHAYGGYSARFGRVGDLSDSPASAGVRRRGWRLRGWWGIGEAGSR